MCYSDCCSVDLLVCEIERRTLHIGTPDGVVKAESIQSALLAQTFDIIQESSSRKVSPAEITLRIRIFPIRIRLEQPRQVLIRTHLL